MNRSIPARIALIPLDERPCNYRYPIMVGKVAGVDVVAPPREMLGLKKRPGDVRALAEWLEEQAQTADALVVAIDTLAFGGLVPSRVSDVSLDGALANLKVLQRIHEVRPELPVLAHNVVMRLPKYNSADEEPDYWEHFGARIHLYSVLLDVRERGTEAWEDLQGILPAGLDNARQADRVFKQLEEEIPAYVRDDWRWRRARNHALNQHMVRWAAEEIFQFLALTQDDSFPLGLPAQEQRALTRLIGQLGTYRQVLLYPGADEVGMALVARHVNQATGWRPRVWVRFSSTMGPTIIPLYEDRPLMEGIKGQVLAIGGRFAVTPDEADIHLFVNSPGQRQREAAQQRQPGAGGDGWRNLPEFLQAVADACSASPGNPIVALADVAYANGADRDLVEMLPHFVCPLRLDAYAAWNTAGNTVGTALAQASLRRAGLGLREEPAFVAADRAQREFLLLRFAEDWAYQADVRQQLAMGPVADLRIPPPYELGVHQSAIAQEALARLRQVFLDWVRRWQKGGDTPALEDLRFPWNRLFEVDLTVREQES